jgi:selenium donor protein
MEASAIYLDFNATTPIDPAVAAEMLPFLHQHFVNPSRAHVFGPTTKQAVERARSRVADLLAARPEEIVFTSGGSESNNMVIQGVARDLAHKGRHIITSSVEHPAVLEPCRALEKEGFRLTVLPVDELGRVDAEAVARAIAPDTILISIMHRITELAREHDILVHTDAAQSVGKISVRVDELGVDFLSLAGHKLYAPKGVGALFIRSGRHLPNLIYGAGHEAGRRAGTENVLEIVGLGKACELAGERLVDGVKHSRKLRDRLWRGLANRLPELRRNGDPDAGLPNTLSVSFRGLDASTLLAEISDRVAASAGAACHAEGVDVSTVLEAMQVPLEYAMGTVRLSVGRTTTVEEVDTAIEIVCDTVQRLSAAAPIESATPDDVDQVRLTRYTHGMGCACKLRPQELEQLLASLPPASDPSVLVGTATADDAAVYRIDDALAVVQTLDFFTPIADDPHDFGAISAANSLSDLYAMGAKPVFALSIVGFPTGRLPLSVLERILAGATEVSRQAGIDIIGGHSVEDTEPKFGLAVTGLAHPDRLLTNAGGQAGDVLVLTKPIGTGVIATAIKRDIADEAVARGALATMRALNRTAAEALQELEVHACTDVTGFGLLGHLREMTAAAGLDAELTIEAIPMLPGARELAAADVVPGGSVENLEHVEPWIDWLPGRSRVEQLLLADAQTSGGLLVALPQEEASRLVATLRQDGVDAEIIGRLTAAGDGRIRV